MYGCLHRFPRRMLFELGISQKLKFFFWRDEIFGDILSIPCFVDEIAKSKYKILWWYCTYYMNICTFRMNKWMCNLQISFISMDVKCPKLQWRLFSYKKKMEKKLYCVKSGMSKIFVVWQLIVVIVITRMTHLCIIFFILW